jgi:hypothetical protein
MEMGYGIWTRGKSRKISGGEVRIKKIQLQDGQQWRDPRLTSYCSVLLRFLPANYNLCRLLYAFAIKIYDWSMRETPNTAVTAACMPTMPSF